jgi:hypothetical protein
LTGWSIIQRKWWCLLYPIGALSGIIPNQSNFGTVFVAINGLQNGAPDGIALETILVKPFSFKL